MVIGKKHTNTTIIILGKYPNPNQIANKGAIVIIGTV
jgi:hypothetical protein